MNSKIRKFILHNDYESLKLFLEEHKNIDLNYIHPNKYPNNLSIGLAYNSKECLTLLFKSGLNINQPVVYDNIEIYGMSALMVESKYECVENVKFLLKNDASIYFKTYDGKNVRNVSSKKIFKIISKHLSVKRTKTKKILYNEIKCIDNFVIDNIVSFLYPKL